MNEKKLAEKNPEKRKAAGFFKAASRAFNVFETRRSRPRRMRLLIPKVRRRSLLRRSLLQKVKTTTRHHKKTAETVEFEEDEEEEEDGEDEEEDEEEEKEAVDLDENDEDSDEDVGMNDSLKADLNSTMGSDIVEFGTVEIGKKADQYENENKPTETAVGRSLDLEAEAEMIKVQGANVGNQPDQGDLQEMESPEVPAGRNRRERSSPIEDEVEDDSDAGSWDEDSITLSPSPKKQPNEREI